jgi:CubicO group peptidase (beta-lactamase class C family)
MVVMDVRGSVDSRFELVRDTMAEVLEAQPGTGAAVAVWIDGDFVVDLHGGWADAAKTRLWQQDSLVQQYSVSKPFAAVCALLLVDRGLLDLDAPVQRYWPEFVPAATVRHLLSHQAGVVALDAPAPTDVFYDWDLLCGLLAAQEPEWEPGTAIGESALFYGHLVGELVRRIDGRSLGSFMRTEVCGPLGLDFFFGLTADEQARAVELTGLDDDFRLMNAESKPPLYERAIANPIGSQDAAVVNSAAWRAAEVPAVNGHGTAGAIAGLYGALMQGKLLSSAVLDEAVSVQGSGIDAVFGAESSWGLGFGVGGGGFGMGGLGGSYAGARVDDGYAFAFVTGSVGTHDRSVALENAARTCLGLPIDED